MPSSVSIKDFIGLLYQQRELIDMLFGQRNRTISKAEVFSWTDMTEEKYDKLKSFEIINENSQGIALDDRLVNFFEEFLEIGEVHVGFIHDQVEYVHMYISYYTKDPRPSRLKKINTTLRKVQYTTSIQIIKLYKLINDTYKSEPSFELKRQKLENYREKRDAIVGLIQETQQILEQNQGFFASQHDIELSEVLLNLHRSMNENLTFLTEIQLQIIDYLNKIQYQSKIYRKIQRIKELKDYKELRYKTDIEHFLESQKAFFWQSRNFSTTLVSHDFLQTDEGYEIRKKVAERIRNKKEFRKNIAAPLSSDFDRIPEEIIAKVDIDGLIGKFKGSRVDLFDFLTAFDFSDKVENITLQERVTIFVEIAMDHWENLHFSDEYGQYRYQNEFGETLSLGYQKIYAQQHALT
jgi:hypothetical protein